VEIAPVPHRSTGSERRRLALGLTVLAPVVLLVLLPAVLGLDRLVVTEPGPDGTPGRGEVVLAREVAPTDLRVGDVLTFRPPGGSVNERVTRRIVSITDRVATTEADGAGSAPWEVPLGGDSSYARVWLGIPWLGYPFLVDGGGLLIALAALAALAAFLLSLTVGRRTPPRVVGPARTTLPVG
jgi:signal peptidase